MNPRIIFKTTATPARWADCVGRSADSARYVPDWVNDSKTRAEIKTGYYHDGMFYRPLYLIAHPEDGPLAYLLDENSAAALMKAWNKIGMRKDKRITKQLAGFIPIKENGSY